MYAIVRAQMGSPMARLFTPQWWYMHPLGYKWPDELVYIYMDWSQSGHWLNVVTAVAALTMDRIISMFHGRLTRYVKIAGCERAGDARNVFPATDFKGNY